MITEIDAILQVMQRVYGKDLSDYDPVFLAQTVLRRQKITAIPAGSAYLGYLEQNDAEAGALLQSLIIAHSEFFRNSFSFAVLEHLILPLRIAEKKSSDPGELRIWSAGCAAGEEAYSLAILLADLTTGRGNGISWRIFATDISEAGLMQARRGVYPRSALQQVRLKHLSAWFAPRGDAFAIVQALQDRIDFSVYDLLDARTVCPPASIYGDFDLIVCCNVLLYYRSEAQQRILNKIHRVLSPQGYLMTGEAEMAIVEHSAAFQRVATSAISQKISRR